MEPKLELKVAMKAAGGHAQLSPRALVPINQLLETRAKLQENEQRQRGWKQWNQRGHAGVTAGVELATGLLCCWDLLLLLTSGSSPPMC